MALLGLGLVLAVPVELVGDDIVGVEWMADEPCFAITESVAVCVWFCPMEWCCSVQV